MKSKTSCLLLAVTFFSHSLLASEPVKEEEAQQIGVEGYIYGYPLVLLDVKKRIDTNVPFPQRGRAPLNQFAHRWELATPETKDTLYPSADALTSCAWLDLQKEPVVLQFPEVRERFFLFSFYDAWGNLFYSLTQDSSKAKEIAFYGPEWKGTLPKGVIQVKAPTNTIWIRGQIQCSGTAKEYAIVNAIQQRMALIPSNVFIEDPKRYHPPTSVSVEGKVDARTLPTEQVDKMSTATFFATLARLTKPFPPTSADGPMVEKLGETGIVAGKPHDFSALDPAVAKGLEKGLLLAKKKMSEGEQELGDKRNGWKLWPKSEMGEFGTDYLLRAIVTKSGLGANSPEHVVYAFADSDSDGRSLTGTHAYHIHFAKEQLPPVAAYWSLTVYNQEHHLSPNPINRYAIQSLGKIKYNDDGSLDIHIQRLEPAKKRANWLPASKGNFTLLLRFYAPKKSVLDGSWTPPKVQRLETDSRS